ncbi:hypothetical protein EXIGLDRAFT_165027 [Exidia glandulosa HHB12029]|uniref:BCS1 N-terminal domain-containing protein n=1 Tax=Exidia glandulosa HHB12029 TaxID=1314781 RepID=A0A166A5U4_EXIGL|nr:hypothetical protein EXIGLDRAFT_165027 [Exidia glandulosa HHB12029]
MDLLTNNGTETLAHAGTYYLQQVPYTLLAGVGAVVAILQRAVSLLNGPWFIEAFRLMLWSVIFEAVRRSWHTVSSKVIQTLFVEVRVGQGDFVWDWLDDYLSANNVWGTATSYRLVSGPPPAPSFAEGAAAPAAQSQLGKKEQHRSDGHPLPIYQCTPDQAEFWKWRGHWIKVYKLPGGYDYKTG